MARSKLSTMDLVVGIALLVLGILVLIGRIGIPYFSLILGIIVLVVGILMLFGRLSGAKWLGVLLTVLGVILLFTDYLGGVVRVLETISEVLIGVVLIVLGALKLMGRL